MRKADLTTRAVAAFVDLLIVLGLTRLPDMIGVLSAAGYLLIKDGLFAGQSVGKKLIGLSVVPAEDAKHGARFRGSIIRNAPLAAAYLLFFIPYVGWALGPLALAVEGLVALGDERGMRIGDLIAGTWTVEPAAAPTEGPDAAGPIDPGI